MSEMSNKHKALEERFRKLPDALRTPENYIEHCLSAGIRQSAIDNRLSALDLFRREAPKKPAKPATKPEAAKPDAKKEGEHDLTTREGREAAAKERLEKRRRAWENEYEDVPPETEEK